MLLLLFNGIGAIYGGWNLMMHPDGSSIQLSPGWLEHTPFDNYLIPGIILFVVNGWFSLVAFSAVIMNLKNHAWLVIAQGAILLGWIVIQMLLIQTVYFLHLVLGAAGIALLIVGRLLLNYDRKNETLTKQPHT